MIKFFRNIRQNMIKQNKVSNYLLYAVGEIVLVVIGILIALQINNNNEEKQRVKREYEIMTNLAEDFKNNLASLNKSLDTLYPIWAQNLEKNIGHFGLKDKEITREMRGDLRWTGFYTTKIIEGSLNSILNSEKLEILRDTKLTNLLTAYPANIADFKFLEDNLVRYVRDVQRDVWRKYISLTEDSNFDISIQGNAAKSDYEGLIGNLYYQNTLVGNLYGLNSLKIEAEKLKSATEEIYNLLMDNINKNPNHIIEQ
jgi:hypothetical protein